ncbi:MAG: tetratricopeptide repeat protein, partial [Promethearchaeota archaeon]
AWYNKGVALSGYGKLRDSIQCFDKTLLINPNSDLALLQKAYSVERLGNLEEANDLFEKYMKISQDDVKINVVVQRKILITQKLEKRGIKLAQSQFEKAVSFVMRKEYEEALPIFESVIKSKPERLYPLFFYATSLVMTKYYDKALKITEKILARYEKDYGILMLQGKIYRWNMKYQEAINVYKKAKEIKNTDAVNDAIWEADNKLHGKEREKEKAKKADFEARCLKGRFHLAAQEYKEGRNYFQEIIEEDPTYDEAWLFLGLSYLLEKNFDDAVESLNKTLELRPGSYRALMILGGALYFLQRYDEAIQKFDIVLERSPKYEEAKEFKKITKKAKNGEVDQLILNKIFYLFAATFRHSELTGKFLKYSKESEKSINKANEESRKAFLKDPPFGS